MITINQIKLIIKSGGMFNSIELKGTKDEKEFQGRFAGESMAKINYTYFAKGKEKERICKQIYDIF